MPIWKTERPIIEHISRHTVLIDRLMPIAERERTLLTLAHLIRSKQVSQWTHSSGLRYWTLYSTKPLSDLSLIRAFGLTLFSHVTKSRTALTSDDIQSTFPQLYRKGLPNGYYMKVRQPPHLGIAKVDAWSRVSRLVERTTKIIDRHRSQPEFRELFATRRFGISWIVPTPQKQRRLDFALTHLSASGARLNVYAIPELLEVAAPIPQSQ